MVSDEVRDALAAACGGAGQVRAAGPADAVAGVAPRWVVAPGTAEQVAAVLSVAAERGLAVVVRGAGTKLDWGAPPERVDLVLDTRRLAGVREHAPGDLVVTVGAGTPLADLRAVLARAGQRLALDPASEADGATVGGVLAAGEAGPLRLRFGAGRDLLIGVEFVRADGVAARSGGRVVKNVAGYDVGRLLCGSYGTLAVITAATFRLHPLPAARRYVCRAVGTPGEAGEVAAAVLASPVAPAAVEVDVPADQVGPGAPVQVAVLVEGTPAGVDARAGELARLLGPDASIVDSTPEWWGRYPFGAGDVALKVAAPLTGWPAALEALRSVVAGGGDTSAGPAVSARGSAGTGVVYAALPGDTPPATVAAALDAARDALAATGGSCVVLAAPASMGDVLDRWGAVPGLDLMRRVKERFDPGRVLSPGRFVGGI
jgi:glycolate oxidase FAD binding subunit